MVCELEYMNMCPPPSPIMEFATPMGLWLGLGFGLGLELGIGIGLG